MKLRSIAMVGGLAVGIAAAAVGCGGADNGVAEELAKQREIAAAKRQGAKDATQSAKIRQLQRELKTKSDSKSGVILESDSGSPAVAPSSGSGPDDWPGGSAYTTILASLGSRSEALDFQSRARADGLDAGILNSSDYGSLNPGYWVVFSGTYDSSDSAGARTSYAKSLGYSDAYPRFVSP